MLTIKTNIKKDNSVSSSLNYEFKHSSQEHNIPTIMKQRQNKSNDLSMVCQLLHYLLLWSCDHTMQQSPVCTKLDLLFYLHKSECYCK